MLIQFRKHSRYQKCLQLQLKTHGDHFTHLTELYPLGDSLQTTRVLIHSTVVPLFLISLSLSLMERVCDYYTVRSLSLDTCSKNICWSGQGCDLAQSTITTPLSIGRAPAKLTCLQMLNADHGAFCNGFSPARAPPTSVRAHVHAQPPSMHVHRTHCSENCTVWPKPDQLDRLLRPCTPSVHLIHRNINLCCTCVCCELSCGSVFIFIRETTAMTGKDPYIYYVYFVA